MLVVQLLELVLLLCTTVVVNVIIVVVVIGVGVLLEMMLLEDIAELVARRQ